MDKENGSERRKLRLGRKDVKRQGVREFTMSESK